MSGFVSLAAVVIVAVLIFLVLFEPTHAAEARPGMRAVAVGTLDDPDPASLRIERHIWMRSKRPWVSIPADVAMFPQGPEGATAQKPSS